MIQLVCRSTHQNLRNGRRKYNKRRFGRSGLLTNSRRNLIAEADILLKSEECVILLVDFQASLGFGVESMPRQVVVNNAVALARTGGCLQSSNCRINIGFACLQWSLASALAGGAPVRQGHRTKKYERVGGRYSQKRGFFRQSKTIDRGWIPHRGLRLLSGALRSERWI